MLLTSFSPNASLPFFLTCSSSTMSSFVRTSWSVASTVLLLPLCTFILCHAARQCRKEHSSCSSSSSSSSSSSTTHSDCITYNMAAMELLGMLGNAVVSSGLWRRDVVVAFVGTAIVVFIWYGQVLFHTLTCVERYLAAVRPVAYRRLRSRGGIRVRNAAVGGVWLLCAAATAVFNVDRMFFVVGFFELIVAMAAVSFCSVAVLLVLLRPGPGQSRDRVDRSKRRAFYTIVTILGALLLRFVGNLLLLGMGVSEEGGHCVLAASQLWLGLPSSLVLPLLFLHRRGRLASCGTKTP